MNKRANSTPKPETQIDKALHTLRTDPRYASMAKSCRVKTESEKAKEATSQIT